MKELEVTLRIRNNLLKERREKLDCTQREMADVIGIRKSIYGGFECLSISPFASDGEWSEDARKTAEYFNCEPEDLFPPSIVKIVAPVSTRKLDGAEIHLLLSSHTQTSAEGYERHLLEADTEESTIHMATTAMARLKPREVQIIRAKFGMDGSHESTYKEQAEQLGITASRAAQIGQQAVWKLAREVFELRSNQNKIKICYVDMFERHEMKRLIEKTRDALVKKFPGALVIAHPVGWTPTTIEVRAYGFQREGLASIQADADLVAKEILSEPWNLIPIAPVPDHVSEDTKKVPDRVTRDVVDLSLHAWSNPPGHRVPRFVVQILTLLTASSPSFVKARCQTLKEGRRIAKGVIAGLTKLQSKGDLTFRRDYNRGGTGRTTFELSNHSGFDLICEEVESRKAIDRPSRCH
jgi:transcriptional regulator with XRE-family HTH domain